MPRTAAAESTKSSPRPRKSSFELVKPAHIRRPVMAIDRDHEREADSRFRCGNRDGKNRDHDSGGILRGRPETPKRDEIQIRSREHQLDADENEDGVLAAERREQTDGEKRRGNDEAKLERGSHRFSSITRTNAPINAAVRSNPTHCSGQT